ncbi:MAG: preprotein translocase subunit SecE [Desulfurobacteriaceae bacterium]
MSPIDFLKEVKEELKRVSWPSKEEVIEATFGVIIFCAIIAVYFFILDTGLTEALKMIIEK